MLTKCVSKSRQFTREVDPVTPDGMLQSPAGTGAHLPPADVRPASEDGPSGRPAAPHTQPGLAGCPWAPASLGDPVASPQGMSDSPGQGLEGHVSSHSLDKTTASASEVLEDPAEVTSPDRTQGAHRTTGEPPSGSPAPSAGAALLPGAHPEVALGDDLPTDEPGPPADPGDTSGPEDSALVGPLRAGGAAAPGPQEEEARDQTAGSSRNGPMRLDLDFSDDAPSERPPAPGTPGGRPAAAPDKAREEVGEAPAPPPRGSYSLDWDKLEDPNFNPFGGSGEARPPERPWSRPAGPAAAEDSPPSQ